MRSRGREVAFAAAAFGLYSTSVLPRVRVEQRRWHERAEAISDPEERALAESALQEKAANVEATAVFAILAPRRSRPAVIRASAALQIAVDYLDSVDERDGGQLEDRLRRHSVLGAAFELEHRGEELDRLRHDDRAGGFLGDDRANGFLAELLATCATAAAPLPRFEQCAPALQAAILRCGEGQAHTHAAAGGEPGALRAWAEKLPAPVGYAWWELAAGASSSVAAHALLALAADPRSGEEEPALVDAAYFPAIGALTVLLDDLVDLDRDAALGEHNYVSYYGDPSSAAAHLGLIADRAGAAIAPLRRRHFHAAILAGVAAFYLSDPDAGTAEAEPARLRLLESLGLPTRFLAMATSSLRKLPGRDRDLARAGRLR